MDTPVPKIRITHVNQICIVVRDIRAAMRQYWAMLGIGPWRLQRVGGPDFPLKVADYHGRPAHFEFYMAHAELDNIQFELIQPLEGKSIYQDFLDAHGEGIQHLGVSVDDVDQEIAKAAAKGIAVVQSGGASEEGRRGHAYLDTEELLHTTFEFTQRPSSLSGPRRAPMEIYPEGM